MIHFIKNNRSLRTNNTIHRIQFLLQIDQVQFKNAFWRCRLRVVQSLKEACLMDFCHYWANNHTGLLRPTTFYWRESGKCKLIAEHKTMHYRIWGTMNLIIFGPLWLISIKVRLQQTIKQLFKWPLMWLNWFKSISIILVISHFAM